MSQTSALTTNATLLVEPPKRRGARLTWTIERIDATLATCPGSQMPNCEEIKRRYGASMLAAMYRHGNLSWWAERTGRTLQKSSEQSGFFHGATADAEELRNAVVTGRRVTRTRKWTRESICQALTETAVDGVMLSIAELGDTYGSGLHQAMYREGDMTYWASLCGLKPNRSKKARAWSREEVIQALRDLSPDGRMMPSVTLVYETHGVFLRDAMSVCGDLHWWARETGLEPLKRGRKPGPSTAAAPVVKRQSKASTSTATSETKEVWDRDRIARAITEQAVDGVMPTRSDLRARHGDSMVQSMLIHGTIKSWAQQLGLSLAAGQGVLPTNPYPVASGEQR